MKSFESQTNDMLISYVEVMHPDDDYMQEQLMSDITSGRKQITYEDMQKAIQNPPRRRMFDEMMAAETHPLYQEERNTRWNPDWLRTDNGKMEIPDDSYLNGNKSHWTDIPFYHATHTDSAHGNNYHWEFLGSMERGSDFPIHTQDSGTLDFTLTLNSRHKDWKKKNETLEAYNSKPLTDDEIEVMKGEILELAFKYGLPILHPKEIAFTDIDRANKRITFNVLLPPVKRQGIHHEGRTTNQVIKGCISNTHHGGSLGEACDYCGRFDDDWGIFLPQWMKKYPPNYRIKEIPEVNGWIQSDIYGESEHNMLPFYFYLSKYSDDPFDADLTPNTQAEQDMLVDRVDAWFKMNGIEGMVSLGGHVGRGDLDDNVYWTYLPLDYTLYASWERYWNAGILNRQTITLTHPRYEPPPIETDKSGELEIGMGGFHHRVIGDAHA